MSLFALALAASHAAEPAPADPTPEARERQARARAQTGGALIATSVLLAAFWAPLAANADESRTAAALTVGFGAAIGVQLGVGVGLVVSGARAERRARR